MVIVIGAFGYLARLADLPAAPMLLGFVLSPMLEEHFQRALMLSRGDLTTFITRPISGTILALLALVLISVIWRSWRGATPIVIGDDD
ncbi:hypothetical protein DUP91_28520 [Salmonella enterica subsp. enterica]|nr:hypothetical protein [Salmonella enterica subsp. enterica]